MKRITIVLVITVLVAVAGWSTYHAAAQSSTPMAELMPQGALLFLEAQDLGGLLQQWNGSSEKKAWLQSDNYEVFSRSRLLLRLQQAQDEFAAAAGVPPDMAFLNGVAGKNSALAIYDIGKLEFVYITRIESARSMETALWRTRSQFEPRESAGSKFFVRTEAKSGRVVAFAVVDDYMVLGTREDLVAGVLSLLAHQKVARLSDEGWFIEALKDTRDAGELRMVIHLAEVVKTPHFRAYWIQDNIPAVRRYATSASDLYRSGGVYREERVLHLAAAPDAGADTADDTRSLAELLRLVPADSGFYRASATPTPEESLALLEQKILTPRLGPAPPPKAAPVVNVSEGTVGSDSSLDERIDTPPSANSADTSSDEALKQQLATNRIRAALQIQSSEVAPDNVFVGLHSTVVLQGSANWDEASLLNAIQRLVAPTISVGGLGASWKRQGTGEPFSTLDGLTTVAVAVRGKLLFISNDPKALAATLARVGEPVSAEPAVYAARFDHGRERQNFYRLSALVDQPSRANSGDGSQPQFFSQNIASFSKALSGVQSQSVVTRRKGSVETQTVLYEWTKQ
jgi:hypothetical protein